MDYIIRNAVAADAPAIAAIEAVCFSSPWSLAQIEDEIGKGNALFFVAESGGSVCGYVSAEDICGECYMNNLAVSVEYRRRGIADTLMRTLTDAVKSRGCEFLTLEVREGNVPARKLYETFGFSLVGVRKNFYDMPKENACIYTLYYDKDEP